MGRIGWTEVLCFILFKVHPKIEIWGRVCQDKSALLQMWRKIPHCVISAKSRCVNVSIGVCRAWLTGSAAQMVRRLQVFVLLPPAAASLQATDEAREGSTFWSVHDAWLSFSTSEALVFFPLDTWCETNNGHFQIVPGPKINFWTETMCPWRRKGLCACVCVCVCSVS